MTEEKQREMIEDLAKAYGCDPSQLKIKGMAHGSLKLEIEVAGFRNHKAAKTFHKANKGAPPKMDPEKYGEVGHELKKPSKPKKTIDKTVRAVFKKYDKDKSGNVSSIATRLLIAR